MSNEQKQLIHAELAKRKQEFGDDDAKAFAWAENKRQGVGIALEVTVRLLAPELFENVLAVVQGRA